MFTKFQPTLQLDRVSQIADFLEKEIVERGFRPGDAFPSAADLAVRFSMSKSTANRVLTQLVEKGVLVRHRGRGNFVGDAVLKTPVAVKSIYIIEAADRVAFAPEIVGRVSGWLSLNQPLGVHTFMLPLENPLRALRAVIGGAWERGEIERVLAISCPREVYEYLLEIKVPTVVIGSLYGDQQVLSSIDRDAHKEGMLLANYLIRQGRRRIGVFQSNVVRPGTQAFLDGIHEAVRKWGQVSLRVRPLPHVESHMLAVLNDLLEGPERPDAIITEGTNLARVAATLAQKKRIRIPHEIEIVHATSSIFPSESSSFPHTHPIISDTEFFTIVHQMLLDAGGTPQKKVIDVELIVPGKEKKKSSFG